MLLTMSSVEAPPFFRIDSSTPRWPSCRTTLVCGEKPSRTLATSPRTSVAPLRVLTGIALSWAMVPGVPLSATAYSEASIFCVPAGRIRFCALTALTMSVGVRPCASSFCVSRSTVICRLLPPYGNGTAMPGTVISLGRRKFSAASLSSCSDSVLLDSPSCRIGMLEAEYLITSGGVMPGGSWRSCACETDTICASAVWMLAVGWKKTLMMETPLSDCDSMCSMSLTVVVRLRSVTETMRSAISLAGRPL